MPVEQNYWQTIQLLGVSRYMKIVLQYIPIFFHCIAIYSFSYIFSKIQLFFNIWINFEPCVIESELYTCIHDCMKTFYKGINLTGIHLQELQLLQDKN